MARRRRNPKTFGPVRRAPRGVALPARVTKRIIEEYVKADFADPRSGRWEPRLWLEGQHDELGLRGPQIKGETVEVWTDQGVPISNISLYEMPSGKYKYRAMSRDHDPLFNQPSSIGHLSYYDKEYNTPMEAVEALLDENDDIWEYAIEEDE